VFTYANARKIPAAWKKKPTDKKELEEARAEMVAPSIIHRYIDGSLSFVKGKTKGDIILFSFFLLSRMKRGQHN
jgi:hypothetical protein